VHDRLTNLAIQSRLVYQHAIAGRQKSKAGDCVCPHNIMKAGVPNAGYAVFSGPPSNFALEHPAGKDRV
jgi:hypothetical protein